MHELTKTLKTEQPVKSAQHLGQTEDNIEDMDCGSSTWSEEAPVEATKTSLQNQEE